MIPRWQASRSRASRAPLRPPDAVWSNTFAVRGKEAVDRRAGTHREALQKAIA